MKKNYSKVLKDLAALFIGQINTPIAFFDLETTGTNTETDEIVEFGSVKIHPDGKFESLEYRFKPSFPIPAGASAVHKIFDQDVADCQAFAGNAFEINNFLKNCILGGYNNERFDVPLLKVQLEKAGIKNPLENTCTYDTFLVYKQHSGRKLADALYYYTGEILGEDAHCAVGDLIATIKCTAKQIEKEGKPLNQILVKEKSPKFEHIVIMNGMETINFGKYKGVLVENAPKTFLQWILSKDFPESTKATIRKYL